MIYIHVTTHTLNYMICNRENVFRCFRADGIICHLDERKNGGSCSLCTTFASRVLQTLRRMASETTEHVTLHSKLILLEIGPAAFQFPFWTLPCNSSGNNHDSIFIGGSLLIFAGCHWYLRPDRIHSPILDGSQVLV